MRSSTLKRYTFVSRSGSQNCTEKHLAVIHPGSFNCCQIGTCTLYISLTIDVSSQIQHLNKGQTSRSSMYRNVTQSDLRHPIMWLEYLELVWLRNRGGSCHSCLVQRWSHWPDRPGPHSLCWEWDYQWCTWCPRSEEKEGGSEGGREGMKEQMWEYWDKTN